MDRFATADIAALAARSPEDALMALQDYWDHNHAEKDLDEMRDLLNRSRALATAADVLESLVNDRANDEILKIRASIIYRVIQLIDEGRRR